MRVLKGLGYLTPYLGITNCITTYFPYTKRTENVYEREKIENHNIRFRIFPFSRERRERQDVSEECAWKPSRCVYC